MLFTAFILSILFFNPVNADTVSDRISCLTTETGDLSTVVVFLNGITNTVADAENSRSILASKLGSLCNGTDCIVQKFYNKTDGFFDDNNELDFIGDLERDSANIAFVRLITQAKIGYLRFRSEFEKRPNFNSELYEEDDKKVWKELTRLADKAKNSSSDAQIEFSTAGSNITSWLIDKLIDSENICGRGCSIFLTSMEKKKDLYDAKFRSYYKSTLTEYYLSNRDFYGNDREADHAVTRTVEGLVSYLEEHMLSGEKIVVVAHSQGNHMIELAYGVLEEKWGASALQSIQVVGVASVASTNPSNTYLTWDDDHVVLRFYDNGSDGDPLVGNFSVTNDDPSDGTNDHSFTEVYMNHNLTGRYDPNGRGNLSGVQSFLDDNLNHPVDDWIIGLIEGSIEASIPYVNDIISTGFITATLRWEQYSDMDLWTNENGENLVSYQDKMGIYNGGLDRDDTDGEGPEHYTADIECKDAANKT